MTPHARDGRADHARAVADLAARLPEPIRPLAAAAYDLRWSWIPRGRDVFRALDPERFGAVAANPVRFLRGLPVSRLEAASADPAIVERARGLAEELEADAEPPDGRPVAFLCAEFGVHASLPTYSGGLGVLAGDYLKQASDDGFRLVAVGLLYRRGYFHQRIDLTGWQRESWEVSDPELLPAVRVTDARGEPLRVSVPVWDGDLDADVWRVQAGRVPLYLLDADIEGNTPVERWVTARLYEGTPAIRLAQYALLGLGAVRALTAMGIEPSTFHLNEGHPALAAVELGARAAPGASLDDALAAVRDRIVFTTHTPVTAGNETYSSEEFVAVLGRAAVELGFDPADLCRLARIHADADGEAPGLTPLAIRAARCTVGVSRRHGEVSRQLWRDLAAELGPGREPIGHVTNGVHLPTWMAPEVGALLAARWGEDWRGPPDPSLWDAVDDIPDADLWAARNALRTRLVAFVRAHVVTARLARGEDMEFVLEADRLFRDDALTIGFARRLAAYKRLGLLVQDPDRAFALLGGPRPVQLVIAGKAHPLDDAGKALAQRLFSFRRETALAGRVAFIEDYELTVAPGLVAGCDVWLNVPRPPLEASGTSGMKAALNGALNLSVLDGWWPEAFDGENGWSLDGSVDRDESVQDARHARELFDVLEGGVLPAFYERDEHGVPHGWVARMKRSLKTVGRGFTTARMLADYRRVYEGS